MIFIWMGTRRDGAHKHPPAPIGDIALPI